MQSTQCTKAFLKGIIDFAGMFPPAKLALKDALGSFGTYLRTDEGIMLSHFLCPMSSLNDLGYHMKTYSGPTPLLISAIGSPIKKGSAFSSTLGDDLNAIIDFHGRIEGKAIVKMYETKLPCTQTSTTHLTVDIVELLQNHVSPFFEISLEDNWREIIAQVAEAFHATEQEFRAGGLPTGVKLRCGGVKQSAFPSVEEVASFIAACREHCVPMKFTAGLHHPFRHDCPKLKCKNHGFVNVFAAGILAWVHDLTQDDISEIVADENPDNFSFDEGFKWKNLSASSQEIEKIRKQIFPSFGCCSFTEPLKDLKTLGWI
ncbi:MAG: hypothetical protein ACI9S8_000912 [Chlamydiales bacterium]|jgi:hypothetical protein